MSKMRDKIVELARTLEETDYAVFGHNYNEAVDTLNRCFDSLTKYQNSVIKQVTNDPIIMFHCEGEEQRYKLEQLDSRRRSAHNSSITSLNELNRICDWCHLEPFADIDTEDRWAVTDFVGDFCSQLFEDGKSRTEDELMAYRKDRRDLYETDDLLNKIVNNSEENKGPEFP